MILIKVPYNLRIDDEVRIYQKLLNDSGLMNVHIAPHTLKTASMFALLTRLEPSKKAGMSLIKKLKLYNGESVEGFTKQDIRELQDEAQREGMIGISPAFILALHPVYAGYPSIGSTHAGFRRIACPAWSYGHLAEGEKLVQALIVRAIWPKWYHSASGGGEVVGVGKVTYHLTHAVARDGDPARVRAAIDFWQGALAERALAGERPAGPLARVKLPQPTRVRRRGRRLGAD